MEEDQEMEQKGMEKEEEEIRWRRGSSYIDDPWVAVELLIGRF